MGFYRGLLYLHLRQAHDRTYFGAWRGSPSDDDLVDLVEALINQDLGEFPLAGFFGNGEFVPIGRKNFFHNYTDALVIFPERRPDRP